MEHDTAGQVTFPTRRDGLVSCILVTHIDLWSLPTKDCFQFQLSLVSFAYVLQERCHRFVYFILIRPYLAKTYIQVGGSNQSLLLLFIFSLIFFYFYFPSPSLFECARRVCVGG